MGTSQVATGLEVPSVGMRGGLGRTLLTAFLVLTILPLSIVSWYATNRSRLNIQEEVTGKLASIAALKEAQIFRWMEEQAVVLVRPDFGSQVETALQAVDSGADEVRDCLATAAHRWGAADLALLSPEGRVEWAGDATWEGDVLPLSHNPCLTTGASVVRASLDPSGRAGLVVVSPFAFDDRYPYIAARIAPEGLTRILEETAGLGRTGEAYLVDPSGMALPQQEQRLDCPVIQAALSG
ncbi:MAG TPA: hypothetical protein ENI37_06830, partial [Chloroflexi bacterium]|nr:hypothetical protein [Chloroflexota bacterium]